MFIAEIKIVGVATVFFAITDFTRMPNIQRNMIRLTGLLYRFSRTNNMHNTILTTFGLCKTFKRNCLIIIEI